MSNKAKLRKPSKPSAHQLRAELSRARLEAPLTPAGEALLSVARETLVNVANRAAERGYGGLYAALGEVARQKTMLEKAEAVRTEMRESTTVEGV